MLQRLLRLNEQLADFGDPPDGVLPALRDLSLAVAFRSLSYSAAFKGVYDYQSNRCNLYAGRGNHRPIPPEASLDRRKEF